MIFGDYAIYIAFVCFLISFSLGFKNPRKTKVSKTLESVVLLLLALASVDKAFFS